MVKQQITELKPIIVVQFLHLIIFVFTFGLLNSLLSDSGAGMFLLALWYTIPLYLLEYYIVHRHHGNVFDKSLPILTVLVLLSPIIIQSQLPASNFDLIVYVIFTGSVVITVMNTFLLLNHIRQILALEAQGSL